MARTPKKKHIHPRDWRAQFPKVKDDKFRDAISVTEAAEIIGVSTTWVRKLIERGEIAGRVVARTCYVVSQKSAVANKDAYAKEDRTGKPGRPREEGKS